MAIIKSFLDQDFYKFTMAQLILHQFPDSHVKFKFKCRNKVLLGKYINEINYELDHLCNISCTDDDLKYLSTYNYLKKDFIEFLRLFRLNRDFIHAFVDEYGQLQIIAEGPWSHVIWFEVFVLAIVQEIHNRNMLPGAELNIARERLESKIVKANEVHGLKIVDFGTRRRFSREWHHEVVDRLVKKSTGFFSGTSNVLLAKNYGIPANGTFAHELYMGVMGNDVKLSRVQFETLMAWSNEYRGELGIALSDIFGFNAFLRDFDKFFAKLFDGCRHDSGDPVTWCDMLVEHYKKLNIDPNTKTAVFSDGLTFDSAIELCIKYYNVIKTSFGIGTSLTNDTGLIEPLPLVMKMIECNGNAVVKLSDSGGKGMCEDIETIELTKRVYDYSPID